MATKRKMRKTLLVRNRKFVMCTTDLTDAEIWRIENDAKWGMYHSTIAKDVLGSKKKTGKVGRYLRAAGISVRDYRNGSTKEAKRVLRVRKSVKLKLAS